MPHPNSCCAQREIETSVSSDSDGLLHHLQQHHCPGSAGDDASNMDEVRRELKALHMRLVKQANHKIIKLSTSHNLQTNTGLDTVRANVMR